MDYDTYYDKLLNIKTSGRDDSLSDPFHHPYEATSYQVLERLANSGYLSKKNKLIDYGCGKGRVSFFLTYQTKCKSIGIDFSSRLINRALDNKKTALSQNRCEFIEAEAQVFDIDIDIDRAYFFNPFPLEVFINVLNKIEESLVKCPREFIIFIYYPFKYEAYLEKTNFHLLEIIDCSDLFIDNIEKEHILVYKINC